MAALEAEPEAALPDADAPDVSPASAEEMLMDEVAEAMVAVTVPEVTD